MTQASTPVDANWLQTYAEDGAGVLRDVIPQEWVVRMRAAMDQVVEAKSSLSMNLAPGEKGAFVNDLFLWRWQDDFRAFVFDSPLPELASQILQSDDIRLLYDQIFVMEPGGATGTPWHQDTPYWPIKGSQVISIWIPFDSVSPENGVVTYVKGSHRWEQQIRPFSPRLKAAGALDEAASGKIVFDPEAGHDFLKWDLEPGDVLVHDGLTVHGAPPNSTSDRRRRALAVRFVGPEVRFDPRPGTWLHDTKVRAHVPLPSLAAGAALDDPLFPRVWPRA